MDLVHLLITLLILCVIFGLVWWALSQIPLPEPIRIVVVVVMVIIAILVLLSFIGYIPTHISYLTPLTERMLA